MNLAFGMKVLETREEFAADDGNVCFAEAGGFRFELESKVWLA